VEDHEVMTNEHADLLSTLAAHRQFLRFTAAGLTDDQARLTPCASVLSVGGLIKHVADVEATWARFMIQGKAAFGDFYDKLAAGDVDWEAMTEERTNQFTLLADETLEEVLAAYQAVADETDRIVAATPDLSVSYPLPVAPWFEPGASWSIRRAVLHVIAETSQHAGHADMIRETIDGQKTMG